MSPDHETSAPVPGAGPRWRTRFRAWFGGATIQGRLVRNFALAILVPALVTGVVGVGMIRQLVFAQAQTQVNADLEAAKEIYQSAVDRLEDAIRIHATRMVIYGALTRRDTTGLAEEMDRIRHAEHLDVLTLTDADGRVFYRSGNPAAPTGGEANDSLVAYRRRHRSDVELDLALRLLVNDASNPRSIAACIPATPSNVNEDSPTIFLLNTPRTSRTSMATDTAAPPVRTMAGAPVDISAAMACAAK